MRAYILAVITDKGDINEVKIFSESLERGTDTWLEVISLKNKPFQALLSSSADTKEKNVKYCMLGVMVHAY